MALVAQQGHLRLPAVLCPLRPCTTGFYTCFRYLPHAHGTRQGDDWKEPVRCYKFEVVGQTGPRNRDFSPEQPSLVTRRIQGTSNVRQLMCDTYLLPLCMICECVICHDQSILTLVLNAFARRDRLLNPSKSSRLEALSQRFTIGPVSCFLLELRWLRFLTEWCLRQRKDRLTVPWTVADICIFAALEPQQ